MFMSYKATVYTLQLRHGKTKQVNRILTIATDCRNERNNWKLKTWWLETYRLNLHRQLDIVQLGNKRKNITIK